MLKTFRYLRVATAVSLLLCVALIFLRNIEAQLSAGFDGPFAHYMSYAFAFNKITLASFLALVLVFDFKIILPSWGRRCLRIIGLASVVLSLLGFVYLTQEVIFDIHYRNNSLGFLFVEFYLFQLAYLLISCVALSKSFTPNLNSDDLAGEPQ